MEKKKLDPKIIEILKAVIEFIVFIIIDVCAILLVTKGSSLGFSTLVNVIMIVIACFSTAMLIVLTVFYIGRLRTRQRGDEDESNN